MVRYSHDTVVSKFLAAILKDISNDDNQDIVLLCLIPGKTL